MYPPFSVFAFETVEQTPGWEKRGVILVASYSVDEAITYLEGISFAHPETGDKTGKEVKGLFSYKSGILFDYSNYVD